MTTRALDRTSVSVAAIATSVAAVVASVAAVVLFDPVVIDWGNPALGQLVPSFAVVDETLAAVVTAMAVGAVVLAVMGRTHRLATATAGVVAIGALTVAIVYNAREDLTALGCGDRACLSLAGPRTAGWVFYYPVLVLAALLAFSSTSATRWHRAYEDAR